MKPLRLDHFPWRPGRMVFFPEPDDIEMVVNDSRPGIT